MILQALYEYYQRKLAINQIDPPGFITKEIDFIIIIDSEGNYIDFENLQSQEGKKLRGKPFRVPFIGKQAQKHDNSGSDPNLLWDKAEFVLGVGKNGKNKLDSFIHVINDYYPNCPDDVGSILKFYEKELSKEYPFKQILENQEIGEQVKKGTTTLTFRINGNRNLIINESHVEEAIKNKRLDNIKFGTCLITGETNIPIENTHMVTKGITGSQTSGANLISFNKPSFLSYHKEQSENAPVSKQAAESYIKALQNLVDSEHNKIKIADATIVFWSEKKSEEINPEEIFPWVISGFSKNEDDPDRGVEVIKKLYNAIYNGILPRERDKRFYILGLAPNAARIAVRFWRVVSVDEFAANIKQHFDDLEIDPNEGNKYLSLYEILTSVSVETKKRNKPNVIFYKGKYYDVIPILSGQLVESIIDSKVFPEILLQQCIIRIRAEVSKKDKNGKSIPNVTRTRAAILKAYLNRLFRIQYNNQKEIKMSLDKTNLNEGYLLGRLFAVIERAQFVSNNYKEPNSGVRDRYFSSFSSSPISVLPIIEKLYGHYLKKIKNAQKFYEANLLEENKEEIFDKLKPANIPSHLTLQQQALFSIGYYHQKLELENFNRNKKENLITNNQNN